MQPRPSLSRIRYDGVNNPSRRWKYVQENINKWINIRPHTAHHFWQALDASTLGRFSTEILLESHWSRDRLDSIDTCSHCEGGYFPLLSSLSRPLAKCAPDIVMSHGNKRLHASPLRRRVEKQWKNTRWIVCAQSISVSTNRTKNLEQHFIWKHIKIQKWISFSLEMFHIVQRTRNDKYNNRL